MRRAILWILAVAVVAVLHWRADVVSARRPAKTPAASVSVRP
jgi:hypothetical protein